MSGAGGTLRAGKGDKSAIDLAKPQAVDYLPKDISGLLQDVVMLIETQAIISKVEIGLEPA